MSGDGSGRLIRISGGPAWNMALDEMLLDAAMSEGVPVLRFYEWPEPAVTIGRYQDVSLAVDMAVCRRRSVPVVRRPTGGRAVYHSTDLTYSLIMAVEALGDTSIRGSYRAISGAIVRALKRLGMAAEEGVAAAERRGGRADCFAHLSVSDIAVDARKVIGSAQLRRGGWLLQQGSIRLWPMEIPEGIFPDASAGDGIVREDPSGNPASRDGVELGLSGELAVTAGVSWLPASISAAELDGTERLVTLKYGCARWTAAALEGDGDGG